MARSAVFAQNGTSLSLLEVHCIAMRIPLKLCFYYLQNHITKKIKKCISIHFLNNNISFDMLSTLRKLYLLVIDTMMEGTVSQILYLDGRFY